MAVEQNQWTPPSYAKPIEENDWQAPDYAKPVEDDKEEEHKPGVFSKALEAIKPAERIHPGEGPKAKLDKFLSSVLEDKDSNIGRMLRSKDPGEEPILPPIKHEPDTWMGGFAKGLYDEFVRPLSSASGIAGAIALGKGGPLGAEEGVAAKELPIKQSREIPYKIAGELPSVAEDLPIRQKVEDIKPDFKSENLPIRQSQLGDEQNIRFNPQTKEKFIGDSPNKILPEDLPENVTPTQKDMITRTLKEGEEAGVPNNEVAQKLEQERQAVEKPKFVNPFEKNEETIKPFEQKDLTVGRDPDAATQAIQKAFNEGKITKEDALNQLEKAWKPPSYAKAIDDPNAVPGERGELQNFKIPKELNEASLINTSNGDFILDYPLREDPIINSKINRMKEIASMPKLDANGELLDEYRQLGQQVFKDKSTSLEDRRKFFIDTSSKPKSGKFSKQLEQDLNPPVKINKELPRVSPEDEANVELWYKYKKLYDSGKMNDKQMEDWAKVHNKVKDLKGSAIIQPHRFETLPKEEPEFTNYILPDGQKVKLSTSATKGAEKTTFQMKGGKIVEAIRDDSPDDIQELSGGLGAIGGGKNKTPTPGPYGRALDKLFDSMGKVQENRVQQDIINKTERARRFAESANIKGGGIEGAKQRLSAMKGEFDRVDLEKMQLTKPQASSLFDAIDKAKITQGEKLRGTTALFKLLNGDNLPQRSELRVLDDVFGNGFASRVVEMHGGLGSVGMKLSKVANTMKAMMSSVDLSFPLKQGIGMIHRPEWRSATVEQLKYLAKPEYYNAAMQAIEERPKYILGREAGLFLAKHGSLESGEEAFAHNYLGKLPSALRIPFDASERAYTGGLNKLRSDLFDNLTELAEKTGQKTFEEKVTKDGTVRVPTKVAENIANYINVFTGRGKLGRLEPIANELNTVFWSPRLLSSRLTALNPKFYYDLDPFTRKEAIKSLFAIATASTMINGLGAAAGAKVGYNVLSSDFAKSRFSPSNNVLDPSGGFQQPVVAAARMIAELHRMSTGGKKQFNKPGIPEIGANLLINKLSPLTGLAYDLASAKKFTGSGGYEDRFGNKKNILNEEGKRFVPMFIQDVYDIVNSDPSFAETVGLLPLTALGAGEQNYPERKEKQKTLFRKPTLR